MDRRLFEPHIPRSTPRDYEAQIGAFVGEVIHSVGAEMQRQPASMVYEILRQRVERRLPGIEVDQEVLRDAAAKISVGLRV